MFLKINSADFSWSRSKRALPVFLLLWSGGLLLALTYLISIRIHLHSIERNETERLLETYLAAQRGNSFYFGSFRLQHKQLPPGISFVRFVRGGDQMLVVGDQMRSLSFKEFASIPADKEGVWLQIDGENSSVADIQTIVLRRLESGTLVQVGKDGRAGFELFGKLKRNTIVIVFMSMIFLWPLSLYFIKLSLSPLVVTRFRLAELAGKSKESWEVKNGKEAELLPEKGSGPELDSLYTQINQLLSQNRHLVSEMQQSLDNVAHDLRTPMTRLRSVAEYGLQAEDDPERLREALSDCLEESERVLAMLRIMMSVAEAEAGTMSLEMEEAHLLQSLKQVVTLYEYVAQEAKIEVSLQIENDVQLEMDVTRMGQVWANLLDNAIKYGRERGRVIITAAVQGERALIYFEDDGIGISENEQQRIWERLYRGDRSRSKKGLGLGLNYAHAVVAAHGGEISVSSDLHKGSCFLVQLPLVQSSSVEDTREVAD